MSDLHIPIELKQAISDNKLIIFVGAGLSYNLVNIKGQQLKGWGNLVEEIIVQLQEKGYKTELLLPLLDIYDPIEILNLIEKHPDFSREIIYDISADFLELDDSQNDYLLHQKISALSQKIITTNYDTAFEKAVKSLQKNKAYKGRNYKLSKHRNSDSRLLFKLHGCVDHLDNMILFPSDYRRFYHPSKKAKNEKYALDVFKNIINNNSVLFIGTGMGDFQINTIFKKIKRIQKGYGKKHFIITNKALDSTLDFLTPIKKEHTEIPNFIDKLLTIKESYSSQESEEVKSLKKDLEKATIKIKELESEKKDPIKLLEGESLKYFRKGLKFQLVNKYHKAIKKYRKSIALYNKIPEVYNNLGISLGYLASKENDESFKEKEKLYNQSFNQFSTSIKIDQKYAAAYYNWANYLVKYADIKQQKNSDAIYLQAINKYNDAININSNFHEAYYNLGNLHVKIAKTTQGQTSKTQYYQALKNYEKALKIKPKKHEAYNNCGIVLATLASTEKDKKAEVLYEEAIKKYRKAVEIKKDYKTAYYNWGTLLTNIGNKKTGVEKKKNYQQAAKKYLKSIKFGGKSYNLACLYALQNIKKEAFFYLTNSIKNKEITIENLLKDTDWKDYFKDPDFIAILEKYKSISS